MEDKDRNEPPSCEGSILKSMLSMFKSASPTELDAKPFADNVFPSNNEVIDLTSNDEMNEPEYIKEKNADNNDDNNKKKAKFHVNRNKISAVATNQQEMELQNLGLDVYNQDEFEQGVIDQVDDAYAAEEEIRLNMVLEKEMKAIQDDVQSCKQEVAHCDNVIKQLEKEAIGNKEIKRRLNAVSMQKENKVRQLKRLQGRQKALILRTQKSIQAAAAKHDLDLNGSGTNLQQALGLGGKETEAERMVRLGEMTPFGSVMASQRGASTSKMSDFEKYLMDQETKCSSQKSRKKIKRRSGDLPKEVTSDEPVGKKMKKSKSTANTDSTSSPFNKSKGKADGNYFDSVDKNMYRPAERDFSDYKAKKRQIYPKLKHNFSGSSRPDYDPEEGNDSDDYYRDDNYQPSDSELLKDDSDELEYSESNSGYTKSKVHSGVDLCAIKEKYTGKKNKPTTSSSGGKRTAKDDGNISCYQNRIRQWQKEKLKEKHERIMNGEEESDEASDIEFEDGFKVPAKVWNKLYRYQKTGVKWLWELHAQQCGGIVGDEMGLGKTIQMIVFMVGLHYSQLRDKGSNSRYKGLGPSIIVCPATIMHQWVKEFHTWWPPFRVAVLHSTGSYSSSSTEKDLIHNIVKQCGVLIMSYSSVAIHQDLLLQYDWHYIVLDEGHKIRNPDAQATLACKQFRTCHRLILSGSPMQNNLKELWSLFDFVFPGKLGTLPDFMAHFSLPISKGGYSNASQVQVQTAYKCACVLRDTINPYLIRRMKADVKTSLQLPEKNEQVLFCRLTDHQREVYQEYLDSKECSQILRGNYKVFPGLITLRKVCNHPDLSTGGPRDFTQDALDMSKEELEYGYFRRSGKMIVIESLLKLWKKAGHKVLLFTQGQQMLNVLELFAQKQGYSFLRMDGCTGIAARQPLIQKFNESPEIFIFLLTTRVGGLGVNLTGADRVIIFDPDWNPSTDAQARERAWRIGQNKQVTIYRLLTTGTIEEKIYHRQIFKQFLTNRVLKDPKQRRFFKSNDLFELFTLGTDDVDVSTETSAIFAGTGSDIRVDIKSNNHEDKQNGKSRSSKTKHKNRFDILREKKKRESEQEEEEDPDIDTSGNNEGEVDFDKDKLSKMREMAKRLSLQLIASSSSSSSTSKIKTEESEIETSKESSSNVEVISGDSCDSNDKKSSSSNKHSCDNNSDIVKSEGTDQKSSHDNKKVEEERRRKKKKKEDRKKRKQKEEEERRQERKAEKKRKKKKRRKDAVFEGQRIEQLDHSKPFVQPTSDDDKPRTGGEDYVLQKLFKNSGGLHSAVQHDTIMMSSNPDYAIIEGEADRVAKEAARALKRSRQTCYGAQSGKPTWTGNHGKAKARFGQKKNTKIAPELPKEKEKPPKKVGPVVDTLFAPDPVVVKHFDGTIAGNVKTGASSDPKASTATQMVMSSSSLLERMKARNYLTDTVQGPDDDDSDDDPDNPWAGSVNAETNPEYLDLVTDIRNHIAFACSIDGQAMTDELVEHFKDKLPLKDSAKFKAMLKQICTFEKREGVGIWRLKLAFR